MQRKSGESKTKPVPRMQYVGPIGPPSHQDKGSGWWRHDGEPDSALPYPPPRDPLAWDEDVYEKIHARKGKKMSALVLFLAAIGGYTMFLLAWTYIKSWLT